MNTNQRDPRLNELLFPYWTSDKAKQLIEKFEPDENIKAKDSLSLNGFMQWLTSEENNVAPLDELDLSHEMNHPLSHYYIASSHNTYLTGHQLTGKSSVEMYRQVLLSGCRCVELDCWDGKQPDDEPIIKHGFTMVTEIPLKEALDAINECAFKTSDFPVILSLENHCVPKQQLKIAKHLKNVFGDALLAEPLPGYPLEAGVELPPPSALLRRILIKNKKQSSSTNQGANQSNQLSAASAFFRSRADSANSNYRQSGKTECEDTATTTTTVTTTTTATTTTNQSISENQNKQPGQESDNDNDSGDEYASTIGTAVTSNLSVTSPNMPLSPSSNSLLCPDSGTAGSGSNISSQVSIKQRRAIKSPSSYTAVKDLSDLVNYIQPVHFISFEAAAARNHSFETSSMSETTCFNLLKLYPVEFVNYNKRQLSRVYPKGTRVDSHNYLPFLFWVAGCQMVALNYQSLDLGMQLYLGSFEYNGRCGYLLKPSCMVQKTANFSPFLESATDHSVVAATVSVRVISGHFIACRRLSTYCEVEMFGLPSDTVRKKFRTKIVNNNAINPAYSSDSFEFAKVCF